MNEIGPLSPHYISSLYNRKRSQNYERLDIQTHEQINLSSEESDTSGSSRSALALSRNQSLSYESLVIEEDISQSQLQGRNGGDQLDVRASQRYSSYLLVERTTLRIEEQFGFSTNQTDRLSGLDTSIEGTASSIFELSITTYQQYETQVLETDGSADRGEILADFMRQISEAIEKGTQDTVSLLERMNGFSEEIRLSVEESYKMLEKLMNQFELIQRERLGEGGNASSLQEDFLATQEEILSTTTARTNQLAQAEIAEQTDDQISS